MQLRLYDRCQCIRAWSGNRNVRTFAGVRTISRLPRHAIQLCREYQSVGDSSLAEVWLRHDWTPPWRVPALSPRIRGCSGDVSDALTELPRLQPTTYIGLS